MSTGMNPSPLAPVELYVLLALEEGESYGYAIMKRVDELSVGAVQPDIGGLYRVLAKMTALVWVVEADAPEGSPEVHPGRTRRYYRMTGAGRVALSAELARLRIVVELAAARDLLLEPGPS